MNINDTLIATIGYLVEFRENLKTTEGNLLTLLTLDKPRKDILLDRNLEEHTERRDILIATLKNTILTRHLAQIALQNIEPSFKVADKKEKQKAIRKSTHDKPGTPDELP